MQSIKKIKVINSFRNQHNNHMQQNIMLKQQHKIFITKFFQYIFLQEKRKNTSEKKNNKKIITLFHPLHHCQERYYEKKHKSPCALKEGIILMGKETFQKLVEIRIVLNVTKILEDGIQGVNIGHTRGKVKKSIMRAIRRMF